MIGKGKAPSSSRKLASVVGAPRFQTAPTSVRPVRMTVAPKAQTMAPLRLPPKGVTVPISSAPGPVSVQGSHRTATSFCKAARPAPAMRRLPPVLRQAAVSRSICAALMRASLKACPGSKAFTLLPRGDPDGKLLPGKPFAAGLSGQGTR